MYTDGWIGDIYMISEERLYGKINDILSMKYFCLAHKFKMGSIIYQLSQVVIYILSATIYLLFKVCGLMNCHLPKHQRQWKFFPLMPYFPKAWRKKQGEM